MQNKTSLALITLVAGILLFSGFRRLTDCEQIDRKQLRVMLTDLGYEVKDLVTDPGKEKYSVTITSTSLNIPVGIEISPSNSIIWLTVNLGPAKASSDSTHFLLLKQNSRIQPNQFYITSGGNLMMGLPVENRGVTKEYLKDRLVSISNRVGETNDTWK